MCFRGVFLFFYFFPFRLFHRFMPEILDVVDSQETTDVFLYVGDLVTVKVYSLTRIAVGNPGIVDINSVTADENCPGGPESQGRRRFMSGTSLAKEDYRAGFGGFGSARR